MSLQGNFPRSIPPLDEHVGKLWGKESVGEVFNERGTAFFHFQDSISRPESRKFLLAPHQNEDGTVQPPPPEDPNEEYVGGAQEIPDKKFAIFAQRHSMPESARRILDYAASRRLGQETEAGNLLVGEDLFDLTVKFNGALTTYAHLEEQLDPAIQDFFSIERQGDDVYARMLELDKNGEKPFWKLSDKPKKLSFLVMTPKGQETGEAEAPAPNYSSPSMLPSFKGLSKRVSSFFAEAREQTTAAFATAFGGYSLTLAVPTLSSLNERATSSLKSATPRFGSGGSSGEPPKRQSGWKMAALGIAAAAAAGAIAIAPSYKNSEKIGGLLPYWGEQPRDRTGIEGPAIAGETTLEETTPQVQSGTLPFSRLVEGAELEQLREQLARSDALEGAPTPAYTSEQQQLLDALGIAGENIAFRNVTYRLNPWNPEKKEGAIWFEAAKYLDSLGQATGYDLTSNAKILAFTEYQLAQNGLTEERAKKLPVGQKITVSMPYVTNAQPTGARPMVRKPGDATNAGSIDTLIDAGTPAPISVAPGAADQGSLPQASHTTDGLTERVNDFYQANRAYLPENKDAAKTLFDAGKKELIEGYETMSAPERFKAGGKLYNALRSAERDHRKSLAKRMVTELSTEFDTKKEMYAAIGQELGVAGSTVAKYVHQKT